MTTMSLAALLFATDLSAYTGTQESLSAFAQGTMLSLTDDDRIPLPNPPELAFASAGKGSDEFNWLNTDTELYLNGGMSFEYKGEVISFKAGFKKGYYDSYVQNYKPVPVLIVTKVTDIVKSSGSIAGFGKTMDILRRDASEPSDTLPVGEYPDVLEFYCTGKDLLINLKNLQTQEKEWLATVSVKDLYRAWTDNAGSYSMQYNDKKIFVVPQQFKDPVQYDTWHFGFVLSEASPFYHTTGLPLDFVELYRYDRNAETYEFKPVAYSIPLGVAFEKKPEGGWNIRDIKDDELSAALDDEALDTLRLAR